MLETILHNASSIVVFCFKKFYTQKKHITTRSAEGNIKLVRNVIVMLLMKWLEGTIFCHTC